MDPRPARSYGVRSPPWKPIKEHAMFSLIDKVEDKYFANDASVAPGGWCCHCWCCCSINFAQFADAEPVL
jgi:hypothetical protein